MTNLNQIWINLTNENKLKLIYEELKELKNYDTEVHKVTDANDVILKIKKSIPSNKRGILLLDFEKRLKNRFCSSISVWLEPLGDKSKLRNLRGIKIKSI